MYVARNMLQENCEMHSLYRGIFKMAAMKKTTAKKQKKPDEPKNGIFASQLRVIIKTQNRLLIVY